MGYMQVKYAYMPNLKSFYKMDINKRIDSVLRCMSRTQFADTIADISQSTVNRQIMGQSPLSAQVVFELLRIFPDLSAEWILTGQGEMLKHATVSAVSSEGSTSISAGGNVDTVAMARGRMPNSTH